MQAPDHALPIAAINDAVAITVVHLALIGNIVEIGVEAAGTGTLAVKANGVDFFPLIQIVIGVHVDFHSPRQIRRGSEGDDEVCGKRSAWVDAAKHCVKSSDGVEQVDLVHEPVSRSFMNGDAGSVHGLGEANQKELVRSIYWARRP